MATELTTAYVSLVPSMKGFGAKVSSELDAQDLGRTLGRKMGKGLSTGLADTAALPADLSAKGAKEGTKTGAKFSEGFQHETDRIKLPADLGNDAGRQGAGAGADFGAKFSDKVKLAAAAGLAALTALAAKSLVDTLDAGAGKAKLGARLGLTPELSEAAGSLAGEVYAGAFGESLDEVNLAVAAVIQNIGGLGTMSGGDLKALTEGALTFADVFDQDISMATSAAGQLIRTGLAKDGPEAFDLLTRAMQGPANKADDLLETTNEYGTLFRELGLDGRTAFGLISQAVKAGARDSDIAADALKEFSIRAIDGSELTAESFKGLRLDAKFMAREIAAGGPRAAKALDMTLDRLRAIPDPVLRSQLAVGLFGTQAEDLGDALFAMDLQPAVDELGKVEGATTAMVDATGATNTAKLETFKRNVEAVLVTFMEDEVIPVLGKVADAYHNLFGEDSGESLRTAADILRTSWADTFGDDAGESLRTGADTLRTAADEHLGPAGDKLRTAWSDVFGDDAGASLVTGADTLRTEWDTSMEGLGVSADTLRTKWSEIFGDDAGQSLRDGAGVLNTEWDKLTGGLSFGADTLRTKWSSIFGDDAGASLRAGAGVLSETWDGFTSDFTTGIDSIKSTVSGLWDDFINGAKALPTSLSEAIGDLFNILPDSFKRSLDLLIGFWNQLSIPQFGPFTIEAFGKSLDIGPFGPFDLPDITPPWRGDRGGVVPGGIGSEQLVMAHGGETLVPTHQPRLAAFRGVDAAIAAASLPGSGGGASVGAGLQVGDINLYGVQDSQTGLMVRHELRKLSLLSGRR